MSDKNIDDILNVDIENIATKGKKKSKGLLIVIVAVVVVAALAVSYIYFIKPAMDYKSATEMLGSKQYDAAIELFEELGDYKDSSNQILAAKYEKAIGFSDTGNYDEAIALFEEITDYEDASSQILIAKNNKAMKLFDDGKYTESIALLKDISSEYSEAADNLQEVRYTYAKQLLDNSEYQKALSVFKECDTYSDVAEILDTTAENLISESNYTMGIEYLYLHSDSEDYMKDIYYDYLTWQMDNHEYEHTAETYEKIAGYGDVNSNKKFAGAKLLSIGNVKNENTEMGRYFSSMTEFDITFKFGATELIENIYAYTFYVSTASFDNKVDYDYTSKYYFDGYDIYLESDGTFKKLGKIVKFTQASEDDDASVTLTIDMPEGMKVTNTEFEFETDIDIFTVSSNSNSVSVETTTADEQVNIKTDVSQSKPLSLNITSIYLGVGESVQLIPSGKGSDSITWSVKPEGLQIDSNGFVTNNSSFERYVVTGTSKYGDSVACTIMGKKDNNMTTMRDGVYYYDSVAIASIENVFPTIGLASLYESDDRFYKLYSYIVPSLNSGETVANKYAEYLKSLGCLNYESHYDSRGDVYGANLNYYKFEISVDGLIYNVSLQTCYASTGRPVETAIPKVEVLISVKK